VEHTEEITWEVGFNQTNLSRGWFTTHKA